MDKKYLKELEAAFFQDAHLPLISLSLSFPKTAVNSSCVNYNTFQAIRRGLAVVLLVY
ncbi:hypothetical protein SSIN_1038 [Streptococcus sinensis]|uniref:Uncharacterized protein n=1 Tax=Streptococcus sinensis TaxID=176090 RepID=A0A0A0DJK2_9STRE|nr:hypothetical protein SSIN_1038 [Streptococcus sinensis]